MGESVYSDDAGNPSRKTPQQKLWAKQLDRVLNTPVPSYPLDDPYKQSQAYTGGVYLAIQAFMYACWGASVGLERPRKQTPGIASGAARKEDPDYVPLRSHPLLDTLRCPNRTDTFADMLAQVVLQYHLHGRALIWGVPNSTGAPERFYVLPTLLTQPAFQVPTPEYPRGAWRVSQVYQGTGALFPGSSMSYPIDAREVYEVKNPHHVYRNLCYSPLTGNARQVDLLEMIDRSTWAIAQNGINPSAILTLMGADQAQADTIGDAIHTRHAGPDRAGRVAVVGNPMAEGSASLEVLTPTMRDMPFGESWDRYMGMVLASVCGLDRALVGLKEGGSYADRWAAIQDFRHRRLEPFLMMVAERLTHGPGRAWGLAQRGVRVIIKLPKLQDPTLMSATARDMAADGTGTVNEVRALRDLDPVPDGDVPPQVWLAKQMQPFQQPAGGVPQQDPAGDTPMAGGQDPGQDPQADDGGEVGAMVAAHALDALGVPAVRKAFDSGKHPRGNPKNKGEFASKGSGGGKGGGSAVSNPGHAIAAFGQGVSAGMYQSIGESLKKTGDVSRQDRKSGSIVAQLWDRVKGAGFHTLHDAVERFTAALQEGSKAGGKGEHYLAALNKHFAGAKPPAKQGAASQAKAPADYIDYENLHVPDARPNTDLDAAFAEPAQVAKPTAGNPRQNDLLDEAMGEAPKRAPQIAQQAAALPGGMETLGRAVHWADAQAQEHASKVAAHLGISQTQAVAVLSHLIRQMAQHAAQHGSATGRVKVGGKTLNLRVQHKPKGGVSGPARPRNPDGAGSLPPRMKAMSEDDFSALIPRTIPRRKTTNALASLADAAIAKALGE